MTAKEKAKELVDKFLRTYPIYDNPTVVISYTYNEAKQCASIVVKEILFSNNTIFETNIPHECWKYWLEVKQEIEKL